MTRLITRDGRTPTASAIDAFRRAVRCPVLAPGEHGYDESRRIWNAMIDRRPGLVVRCLQAADVQAAIEFARRENAVVSIRGGGHNIAGLALCDEGLLIDLSLMKSIRVDAEKRIAVADAGLTWAEFDRETQHAGLATTGGAVSTTGIAGLTLGGGFGWLAGRCGYTVDNLISADIVLHDGRAVTASSTSHPDLFWALRGGGGNFGVVTSFSYRLHQVGPVWAGLIVHPLDRLSSLLRSYRDAVAGAPDELTVHAAVMTLPTGERVAALLPLWCGDPSDGERHLAPLRGFGSPLVDTVQPQPYTSVQSMLDGAVPYGRHNYWKSGFLRALDDEAIERVEAHARQITSPYSLCLIEHIHGALTRIPADATAFAARREQFHFVAIASWEPTDDRGRHIEWARAFWSAMQPWSAGRAYMNVLGADESDRIAEAYGPSYERLSRVKAAYDPTNFFSVNHNITPASLV